MRTIVACSAIGVVAVIALAVYRLSYERDLTYVPYHGPPVVIRDDESTSTLFALLGSASAPAQNDHTVPTEPVPPFPDPKKYASAKYWFFLYVPGGVEVDEERTVGYLYALFKDARSRRGFQVFVTPYTLAKITDKRFYLDEPSGIMNQPVNMPSRPGEFHPEPLADPDVTLSRHPARATARRLPPSIECRAPPVAG